MRGEEEPKWWSLLVRNKMLLLMLGGALGTLARYWVGRWIQSQPWAKEFPYGTLAINVTGSFLLGFFAVLFLERLGKDYVDWYLLLGTGFCGGYTTFSTFELETLKLMHNGNWQSTAAYVGGSVLIGLVGVWLGVLLAGVLFPK